MKRLRLLAVTAIASSALAPVTAGTQTSLPADGALATSSRELNNVVFGSLMRIPGLAGPASFAPMLSSLGSSLIGLPQCTFSDTRGCKGVY
ncbi:hypothetical protein H0194_07470 [Corynebacterium incognita]|uniref:Secreted protein n=1 Tax=Corynebacterium incognita TaxID=2754725 RepID=A0A7G7CMV0_9CORY|nr:hypothetical protein [Corynebacterium incognita]QNE88916.1 hypothetical protein H0194_07470 [Corynebacterium incognita]